VVVGKQTVVLPVIQSQKVDSVVPAGNIAHFSKVLDIVMMVFTSGHERTEQEFRNLFEKADFKLTRVTMTPSPVAIVEAIPA
jgi:orsellinic acid C3-O-methyltransferase